MQSKKIIITASLICTTIIWLACSSSANEADAAITGSDPAKQAEAEEGNLIPRGEYLLTVGGCNDCHTPKIFSPNGMSLDSSKLYSGHPAGSKLPSPDPKALVPGQWLQMAPDVTAFVGPWGISYAANLTPDSATGIGTWTADVFIKTLRTGKHLGMDNGRPILPPMPWPNLAKLKDEDLKAIYTYLMSLPPISNRVPGPVPPNELK